MSRWLAIQCPNCGMWQGREIRKDIKKALFKCKFCNKGKKITTKGKASLNFKDCFTEQNVTLVVTEFNKQRYENDRKKSN